MAELSIVLEGLPLRSNGLEVRNEVFPADARKFRARRRRDSSMCLWWRGFLVRIVDNGGNGCEVGVWESIPPVHQVPTKTANAP